MSDNIKVVVKVRPLISREIEDKLSFQWRVENNSLHQLDQNGRDLGHCFTFDKVYDENSQTTDVYNDIAKPIVEAATAGINGTIFAYGQTSSGKTYTMAGTEEAPGIIPLAVYNLFDIIKNKEDRDFLLRISYIEIYNETVKDLLNGNVKVNLSIDKRSGKEGEVKVMATEKVTSSPEEVLALMKQGEANRQIGATNMNEQSSRSHSIFQITIESREHTEGDAPAGCVNVSQLNLVDLAGSERSGQTGATGLRFKEGTHINKSLSTLALVIKQLSEDQKFANYRDSKLTHILRNSLGGNAKTSIVCAVTPAAAEETTSTLQFANRAKAIKNKPEVNEVETSATMLQRLSIKLSRLQTQLEDKKTLEKDNRMLTKKIEALQRQILNGFGQKNTHELSRSDRRKTWCAPRRVTIDSLPLHTIDEDMTAAQAQAPRFCTPGLKYNPATLSEFLLRSEASRMPRVSEESQHEDGHVTPPPPPPPPREKKVNFDDEIIDLDSDDESKEPGNCSPYHKCYDSTKTPPCVLREIATKAEKNLQNIVKLTEREKIYAPSVVELMEKLEQNTTVIAKLQDEVHSLNERCVEKNAEVERMKAQIVKAEEETRNVASAKAELESKCKEFNTKLTDLEVIYETLKKKSKSRENELLSLLDEKKIPPPKHTGKSPFSGKSFPKTLEKELNNFMDMSKDISLVLSDNECSVANDETTIETLQEVVQDIQAKLAEKTNLVIELESKLCAHLKTMAALESTNSKIQPAIAELNEKVKGLETEKSYLESTVKNQNSIIQSQKENLDSANNDLNSYNSLIHELQLKLNARNVEFSILEDNVLEGMIAIEDKFLANNDNMRNIIQTLKTAVITRNTEINRLKSEIYSSCQSTVNVEEKEKQLVTMAEEIDTLKQKMLEYVKEISTLTEENKSLTQTKSQLELAFAEVTEQNRLINATCEKSAEEISRFTAINEDLKRSFSDKELSLQEQANEKQSLHVLVGEKNNDIKRLHEDLTAKNYAIEALTEEIKSHDTRMKSVSNIIQNILTSVTGHSIDSGSEKDIDNETVFKIVNDHLNSLKTGVDEFITQRESLEQVNSVLKIELKTVTDKYQNDIKELQSQHESFQTANSNIKASQENMSQQIENLTQEVDKLNIQLENKIKENLALQENLQDTISESENRYLILEQIKTANATLQDKASTLVKETENLNKLLHESQENYCALQEKYDSLSESSKQQLEEANKILSSHQMDNMKLTEQLGKTTAEMMCRVQTMSLSNIENENTLKCIYDKVFNLTVTLNVENGLPSGSDFKQTHFKQIPQLLDKICKYLNPMSNDSSGESDSLQNALAKSKAQIHDLSSINLKLTNVVNQQEEKMYRAATDFEAIQKDNKELHTNLSECNEFLANLQEDIMKKSSELESLQKYTEQYKNEFVILDNSLKHRINDLETENSILKTQCAELERDIQLTSMAKRVSMMRHFDDDTNEVLVENISKPQSLITMSLHKIIEVLSKSDSTNVTPNSSDTEISYTKTTVETQNAKITSELEQLQRENEQLRKNFEFFKLANKNLIEEQEEIRKEINLFIKPAADLQKVIVNHRKNLSTLTSTTYAENKVLQSQLRVLQNHHSRFHNVCQKDISAFKKQLQELYNVLKLEAEMKQNASFKRYSLPDVLDENTTMSTFKNESTLDGELLMLDTNMTLATSDNTLTGHDQTGFNISRVDLDTEVLSNIGQVNCDPVLLQNRIEVLLNDNLKLSETIEALREDNKKLSNVTERSSDKKFRSPNTSRNFLVNSIQEETAEVCSNCKDKIEILTELKQLSEDFSLLKEQYDCLQEKHNTLYLEVPSSEALARKLNALEKEYKNKTAEVTSLTNSLSRKNRELKQMQEENDTLSTQVMENITECDDLRKELDALKEKNIKLEEMLNQPQQNYLTIGDNIQCSRCHTRDKVNKHLSESESLDRSQRDLDTTLRHNKICHLHNELLASREDCNKINEEVTTIKKHLERSNHSVTPNLDDSMGESNIFSITKDFDPVDQQAPSRFSTNIPNIIEEQSLDYYAIEKAECVNYYVEKTGTEKENLNLDIKILDVMKKLYNNLLVKHGNEVENLVNKLRDLEDTKTQLQTEIDNITLAYTKVSSELEFKASGIEAVTKVLASVKASIRTINDNMSSTDSDKNIKLMAMYKDTVLNVLDREFSLTTTSVLSSLIDSTGLNHQNDLSNIIESNTKLKEQTESLTGELSTVKENLEGLKKQLAEKDEELSFLTAKKEKIFEICNAVTLDIIRKEKELSETISKGCQRLLENNIIHPGYVDLELPVNKRINLLFELLVTNAEEKGQQMDAEKENMKLEVKNSQTALHEKEQELNKARLQNSEILGSYKNAAETLAQKEMELQAQKSLYDDLSKEYEDRFKEHTDNVNLIHNMRQELAVLKDSIIRKEELIKSLEDNINNTRNSTDDQLPEYIKKIQSLETQISEWKAINEVIMSERNNYASELRKAGDTIKVQNEEISKLTADVNKLTECVKEKISLLDNITLDSKKLFDQNQSLIEEHSQLIARIKEVQENSEQKNSEITRLERNIKTHQKSVEIQSSIVTRLRKQNDEDAILLSEKDTQLQEISNKYAALQHEFDAAQETMKSAKEEINNLQTLKTSLELRISELERESDAARKGRTSDVSSNARRRRQSLLESKRQFAAEKQEFEDDNMEAMFASRDKPDDLFAEVDDGNLSSNRSTPSRNDSRRRDSLFARGEQSDKDEDPPSRPSSVLAARRRRQSIHDMNRSVLQNNTPSPRESLLGTRVEEEFDSIQAASGDSAMNKFLKETLSSCKQELEELKERYRELDEECEICAEYLRERDEQCLRLKREKATLEKTVAELKSAMDKADPKAVTEVTFSSVAVNTDEDWANLHSVVVDRMSFDAEVEKNKRLTRAVEEFRLKNREVKATAAKMQRALEKYANKEATKSNSAAAKELESTLQQLASCRQELAELQQRYQELDEECETCAEYLRERDEQCARLREAKLALEEKLEECQKGASSRKKRQSAHDLNRGHSSDESVSDSRTYQVEGVEASSAAVSDEATAQELKLRRLLERVRRQKTALERQVRQQAAPAPAPVYVAAGSAIVQNQQFTDIMKENQKLKKVNAHLVALCKKRGKPVVSPE